jgi:hypothetical protein
LGNQGGGTQGYQGGDNPGGGGIVKTVVTQNDVINPTLGLDRFNPNANITGVAKTINYVDFLGRSGSDLGVLPSVGFSPLTIDAGLNFSNKGPLVGGGFGTGVPIVNNNSGVNAILGTSGSSVANKRSFISDSLGTRNGAGSNSGVTVLPPAGNTEKIVKGKVKTWSDILGDTHTAWQQYFSLFSKSTTNIRTYESWDFFNYDRRLAKSEIDKYNYRAFDYIRARNKGEIIELQVESIYYLSVGDLLVSKDEHVKIEITYLSSPGRVRGIYIDTNVAYSLGRIGVVLGRNVNSPGALTKYGKYTKGWVLKTILYEEENIDWTIIKKNSGGNRGGGNGDGGGGGGGGEGTGVKQPL